MNFDIAKGVAFFCFELKIGFQQFGSAVGDMGGVIYGSDQIAGIGTFKFVQAAVVLDDECKTVEF